MLDMIDFMERLGGDAQLSQASSEEWAVALADSEVTPEQRTALLARNGVRLRELLGTPPVCIMIAPPGPGPGAVPPSPLLPPPPPPLPEEEMEKYYGDA